MTLFSHFVYPSLHMFGAWGASTCCEQIDNLTMIAFQKRPPIVISVIQWDRLYSCQSVPCSFVTFYNLFIWFGSYFEFWHLLHQHTRSMTYPKLTIYLHFHNHQRHKKKIFCIFVLPQMLVSCSQSSKKQVQAPQAPKLPMSASKLPNLIKILAASFYQCKNCAKILKFIFYRGFGIKELFLLEIR